MTGRVVPSDRSPDTGLVDDVRRFGIDVAEEIAGRFTRMVAPLAAGADVEGGGNTRRGDMTDEVAAATAAALRLLDGLAAMAGELATRSGLNGADPRRPVVVMVARPTSSGSTAPSGSAVLWIHNTTPETVSEVTFVTGDLVGSHGGHLPASAVRFTPARVVAVDGGSSLPVTVTVTVPPSTGPGVYHGVVVATGIDADPLHLRIELGETEGNR